MVRGAGYHLGWHAGAQRARALLGAAYTASTKRNYMHAWDRFAAYCAEEGLCALPAHYSTVAGYLGHLHLRGSVSVESLSGYLAPIDTVHELSGYPPPTHNPVFSRLRKSYWRLDAAKAGALPLTRAPLPADVVHRALILGSRYPNPEQRRVTAGLVLAFRTFNRSGTAAAVRAADLSISPQGLHVQLPFHKSDARTRARVAFLVPFNPRGYQFDAALYFLRAYHRDYLAAGGSPTAPLLAPEGTVLGPRVTSQWLAQVLEWVGVSPPVGTRWSGKSIRSVAATAANAVGVPLAVVAAYMEHSSPATKARHYTDARTQPIDEAWFFFGHYTSDWDGFPGPSRQGC